MDDVEVRPCKFGGVECTWSDRGRADCYVCSTVRGRLSILSRLQRENWRLVDEVRDMRVEIDRLCVELEMLRQEHDKLMEERDKAWHLVVELRRRVAAA